MSKALEKIKGLKVSELCKYADVSRSGYYDWRSRPDRKISMDEEAGIKIFESKNEKAGYRTIKMLF